MKITFQRRYYKFLNTVETITTSENATFSQIEEFKKIYDDLHKHHEGVMRFSNPKITFEI